MLKIFTARHKFQIRIYHLIKHRIIVSFKATIDPDTLYLHQAMKTLDWPKFRIAIQTEMDDRIEGKNLSVIQKSKILRQPQYSQ